MGRARVEGWLQRATAEALFEMAGLDFEEAKPTAADRGFRPVALGIDAHTEFRNTIRRVDSRNVVARIEGGEAADELMDWWDLSGAVEDLDLYFQIGHRIASDTDWPRWSESSEFQR